MTHMLLLALAAALGMLLSTAAQAEQIRSAPVDDFGAIQRNERTERYLRDFDRAVEHALDSLDPDTGLIRIPDLLDPDQFDWALAKLERHERKRRITPQYL